MLYTRIQLARLFTNIAYLFLPWKTEKFLNEEYIHLIDALKSRCNTIAKHGYEWKAEI